jgi:hypothetical protein
MNLTDEQYIELYDEFRLKTTAKASDAQLKFWGHSDEDIVQIKIKTIKQVIQLHDIGIEIGAYICKKYGQNVL